MSSKLCVVFGASGDTGKPIVQSLLLEGTSVRAFVRTPSKLGISHQRLEITQGDLTDASAVKASIKGADVVICLAGGPADRSFQGGFLLPVAKTIVDGMLLHGVSRLVMQLGAMCIAPTTMMPNEAASTGFFKGFVLRKMISPYVSKFHGCHVDNDLVLDYFASLDAATNAKIKWTLTRPTALDPEEGGFGHGSSQGKLISAEHLRLPAENGAAFCDFGPYYAEMIKTDDPKWVHSAPFVRYERLDKSDVEKTARCLPCC
mmetsp:Transcript_64004/g.187258  ORF Transcript_64004/g.187258 Transcript_64004/m.187258 type:complete len:260 (+) Transcript_64004:61-840(+)